YKVIFVPFAGGRPSGQPIDVLTGFVDHDGKALGRPVGVVFDKAGALLVADDVGNTVWRVTRAAATAASAERPGPSIAPKNQRTGFSLRRHTRALLSSSTL